jgi:hypothetical protein
LKRLLSNIGPRHSVQKAYTAWGHKISARCQQSIVPYLLRAVSATLSTGVMLAPVHNGGNYKLGTPSPRRTTPCPVSALPTPSVFLPPDITQTITIPRHLDGHIRKPRATSLELLIGYPPCGITSVLVDKSWVVSRAPSNTKGDLMGVMGP